MRSLENYRERFGFTPKLLGDVFFFNNRNFLVRNADVTLASEWVLCYKRLFIQPSGVYVKGFS